MRIFAVAVQWVRVLAPASILASFAIGSTAAEDVPSLPEVIDLISPIEDVVAKQSLDLELGKSVFMRVGFPVKRVSIGDPAIVDVVVLSPSELQLVPKRIGETNMIVWERDGDPAVILDVSVGTSFTTLERRLQTVLNTDSIQVESFGAAVALTGSVPSPVMMERAIQLAGAYFIREDEDKPPTSVVNALEVGGNQQVMIEVIVAEISRSLGRRLTINWDTMIETGVKTFTFTNFMGDLISLDEDPLTDALLVRSGVDFIGRFRNPGKFGISYFVEAAVDHNLAKILAKPTLMSRSGQTASVLIGGEVPIPIAQEFGSISIEFKTFGIAVEFTPTVLGPERIHLEVAPEVSEPDFTLGAQVSGVVTPGFVTRRASTSVELGDGQTFAIAGLLKDNTKEFVEKYPGLGDVPVLGALFRSTDYRREETELVILVTPHLVRPLPEGPPPLPTDHFVDPNGFEFFLLGAMESQRGGEPEPGASAGLIGPSGHRVPAEIERNDE